LTTNFWADQAAFVEFSSANRPEAAPAGTVTFASESLITVRAESRPSPTIHAEFKPVKPLPLTVITVPGAPDAGEKFEMVGTVTLPAIAGSDVPASDTANTHQ
jgi:hypothetical protein